ncbi:hypothetical protein K493DRAFT_309800 [Basidiobolus meristosporus CBS 931.73]|uniref:Inhibitor I9 domain-containing protein n=1 Tax=Basidiobolus meristosporus CBS 931.73 TaxID=1314790 RepID=A0A1Y1VPH1_9FUNG|nr:hypothetical protein K493DRAFT_309800 [Basidiobolus meristosporus CBS 931.73]|eukprot:ORX62501.1 hypothetical protein K493DRAFT_309800 [Basidiobolus meristosporus CBS 931.73]
MVNFRTFTLGSLVAILLTAQLTEAQIVDVSNKYIVKIKEGADSNKGPSNQYLPLLTVVDQFLKTKLDQYNRGRSGNNGLKNELKSKFSLESFNAYAGTLSQGLVSELKAHGDVEYVEAEQVFTISGVQTNPPSWDCQESLSVLVTPVPLQLPRLSWRGVDVYIIDTGINVKHTDLGVEHPPRTVGGNTYGVAKKAKLIGVKVLSGSGSGTTSGVISGVNWVAEQAKKSGR